MLFTWSPCRKSDFPWKLAILHGFQEHRPEAVSDVLAPGALPLSQLLFCSGTYRNPLIWTSSLPLAREADAGPCHQPFCRAQFWPLGCAVTWNSHYLPFPHHPHASLPLAFGLWLIFQFLELDASHSHLGSLPRLYQPPPSGPSVSCCSAEPSLPRCVHISKHMLISYPPQGGWWPQSAGHGLGSGRCSSWKASHVLPVCRSGLPPRPLSPA